MQEVEFGSRFDDEQAVRLADGAGDLGEELAARAADRDGQADLLADAASDRRGDVVRRTADPTEPPDVEEGLVDRDPLDHRSGVVEDVEDLPTRLHVGLEPRPDDDRVGTECPRLVARHRRSHPAGLGLIARREDDAAAD